MTSAEAIVDMLLEDDPEEFMTGVAQKDPFMRAMQAYELYTRSAVRAYDEIVLWMRVLKALGYRGTKGAQFAEAITDLGDAVVDETMDDEAEIMSALDAGIVWNYWGDIPKLNLEALNKMFRAYYVHKNLN